MFKIDLETNCSFLMKVQLKRMTDPQHLQNYGLYTRLCLKWQLVCFGLPHHCLVSGKCNQLLLSLSGYYGSTAVIKMRQWLMTGGRKRECDTKVWVRTQRGMKGNARGRELFGDCTCETAEETDLSLNVKEMREAMWDSVMESSMLKHV